MLQASAADFTQQLCEMSEFDGYLTRTNKVICCYRHFKYSIVYGYKHLLTKQTHRRHLNFLNITESNRFALLFEINLQIQ